MWRAFNEGRITEPEAEDLSAMIEARRVCADIGLPAPDHASGPVRRSVGSRPRTGASMERRRRWAASGRLPPALAAQFTLAEQAVLAMVAAETARRGDCRLAVGHLAAIVGVSETTVRNAIREARLLGLLTVKERQITGFRNDTNIVRIVSPEWIGWLRLTRRGGVPKPGETGHPSLANGGGCKSPNRTPTQVLGSRKTGISGMDKRAARICESAHASSAASCRRMSPALRCGRRRAGPMLRGGEGLPGAGGLDGSGQARIRAGGSFGWP